MKRSVIPEPDEEIEAEERFTPQQYLRPADAAKHLHLSTETLAKWRIKGTGPTYRKHGSKVIYGERDLEVWSDQQRRTSTSQTPEQAREASC